MEKGPIIARKYFFDGNDFGEEALRRKLEAARRPTFSPEQLEAARQDGYDRGRTAGISEMIQSQEAQIRDVLQQVVFAADRLEQGEQQRLATFIDQAALVAAQGLVKTCPAMLGIFAFEQIDGFVREVLAGQVRGQTLALHVAPEHAGKIAARLEEAMASARRRPACAVMPDPALSGLQCRFEWSGGGAEWDPAATAQRLLDTIVAQLPPELVPQVGAGVDEAPRTAHNETDETGDVT